MRTKDKPARPGQLEEQVYAALARASEGLTAAVVEVLRPAGLSAPQYNVLRILRGAGPAGLRCTDLRERLINRDPDITRLLDRLETAGWIARQRSRTDRRAVHSVITPAGLDLLAQLDTPVREAHAAELAVLGEKRLRKLLETLQRLLGEVPHGAADDDEV
ncbi:MAG: MarR family transcriptional regulator [Fimbriimonadaceae bacterium]|nr:MarR family transcriptional regulator [Fimbriimonadaceae bacterium]